MRNALSDTGEVIAAAPGMPNQATCPLCEGRVTLRKRRLMRGGVIYFWRHVDYKKSKSCAKRVKPYKNYS